MPESKKRKKDLGHSAIAQYKSNIRSSAASIVYAALIYVFLLVLVLLETMPVTYDFTVGQAVDQTVYAIADVEDIEQTKQKKERAASLVADIYTADEALTQQEKQFFSDTVFGGFTSASLYGAAVRIANDADGQYITAYATDKVNSYADNELSFLKNEANLEISSKVIAIMASEPDDVQKLKTWFTDLLNEELRQVIGQPQLETVAERMEKQILECTVINNTSLKEILAQTVKYNLFANGVIDEKATQKARDDAAEAVETVYKSKGDVIVEKDDILTQSQFDMMAKLGMIKNGGIFYRLVIGTVVLVLVILVIVIWYMVVFEPKTVRSSKKVLLVCLLTMVNIAIAIVFKSIGWRNMMNTVMCTVLVALFFNSQLAIVINAATAAVISLLFSDKGDLFGIESIALLISSFCGGLCAVYTAKSVSSTSHSRVLVPGIAAGLMQMITMFVVLTVAGKSLAASGAASLYALAGCIILALFSTGSVSVWENAFNMLTPSKLMELSNSGSDLLRKISIEIPGTYQHSVTVAEMAENAAKDIGANYMLARAAALYHDIGKMRIPECYTENQTEESKNFHNTLSPYESTKMIFSHISEGVKMAKENKLPQEIIDIIQQHHGTSAVMSFYNKAKEIDPNANIDDFRYPGPNPKTKEAGIILLADCIEASVRSMDIRDNKAILAQIEKMCKMRMEDGELDDCDLSLKELNTIKASFASTLSAVYHTRIKYEGDGQNDGGNN